MNKKIIIVAVVVLAILVAVCLIFFRTKPFAYSGVAEAVETDLSARLNEVIEKYYIKEGDDVEAGAKIADLDCKDVFLGADIAEKEYKRVAQMYKAKAASAEEYDLKEYQHKDAQNKKSWCYITSPVKGRILYKYYEEGEFVPAGRKIATVADLSKIDAWFYVEHDKLSSLKINQKITGTLPETGERFDGYIYHINDEAEFTPKQVQTKTERARLVYGIKVRFENKTLTLKPGMTLEADL
ncbi:HlyD family secretion protein [Parelusimicrobium proximum]|uniref:efflux RND transporter periplasmic adaptor subunit n=1 Tax=Parelusimicrobium proximum TaxID=3228953 RepID=UPI003D18468C